ncbi:MAG TPA: hypothetical protein EYP82_07610 [Hydrogenothermaceae bacterium]|nr:hypothetical protein [Hydrogenothermaceae bacterium]
MKKLNIILFLVFSFLLCVNAKEPSKTYDRQIEIIPSQTPEGIFNSRIILLADQLEQNLTKNVKCCPIVITTFVSLDNIEKTSHLGRLIKENLQHELLVRRWKVLDIRLSKNLYINKDGEFILSRNINKLKLNNEVKIESVLVGTYSKLGDSIIVNAKLIRVSDNAIVSSGQIILPAELYDIDFCGSRENKVEIIGE